MKNTNSNRGRFRNVQDSSSPNLEGIFFRGGTLKTLTVEGVTEQASAHLLKLCVDIQLTGIAKPLMTMSTGVVGLPFRIRVDGGWEEEVGVREGGWGVGWGGGGGGVGGSETASFVLMQCFFCVCCGCDVSCVARLGVWLLPSGYRKDLCCAGASPLALSSVCRLH